MQRDEFLNRVRSAAAAGRAYPVEVNRHIPEGAGYVGGGDDPVATFLREWTLVGGFGERVPDAPAALAKLAEILARHAVRSVLAWKHPVLELLGLEGFLRDRGVAVHRWDQLEQESPVQRWDQAFAAHLGITSVDWAIAETGSLALCARPGGRGRAPSLLPPVAVTFLTPDQILPDLFDLFAKLEGEKADLPSNITLITGPSKTGDIQLKLTTGVHGPGEVYAIVVEKL